MKPREPQKNTKPVIGFRPGLPSFEQVEIDSDILYSDHIPLMIEYKDGLKILTWNICASTGPFGCSLSSTEEENKKLSRYQRITKALTQKMSGSDSPAIIALQETGAVENKFIQALSKQLDSNWKYIHGNGSGYGILTLYDSTKFKSLFSQPIEFEEGNYRNYGMEHIFKKINDNREFIVVNIHKPYIALPNSLEYLFVYYKNCKSIQDKIVYLAGDFNSQIPPFNVDQTIPLNIITAAVPQNYSLPTFKYNNHKHQGADFPDAGFLIEPKTKQIYQAQTTPLNPKTWQSEILDGQAAVSYIDHLTDVQREELLRFRFMPCLNTIDCENKIPELNNKSFFEYEIDLRKKFNQQDTYVRSMANGMNERRKVGIAFSNYFFNTTIKPQIEQKTYVSHIHLNWHPATFTICYPTYSHDLDAFILAMNSVHVR